MTPKATLRKAIAEMCKQCIYDPKGGRGTWREQVYACTAGDSCPLFPYRPVPTNLCPKGFADLCPDLPPPPEP